MGKLSVILSNSKCSRWYEMRERVFRFIKKIKTDFIQDVKCYSTKLALFRVGETIFQSLRLKKKARFFTCKKNSYVLAYLKKNYKFVFDKFKLEESPSKYTKDDSTLPIWVCWLDGIENAPLLVQKCVRSIKKNAGLHPVHLITKENYMEYVTLPEYIIQKTKNGLIGAAHFTDVLRICLLDQYGGLWLDATIYCKEKIPEEYFNKSFFTCKSKFSDVGCVSNNQWTTFCLGGEKKCIIFQALREFFYQYWMKENQAIDYLFFDDAIEIARECVPEINYLISSVPYNNINRDHLILRFADPWQKGYLDDLFDSSTILFKLGYREKIFLNEFTSDGKPTVYSAFLRGFEKEGDL